ncbi:MAG TPA: carboxypeptidase regulatory-like domain-containing protein, partial [Pyrinomonadaceae bacterium]|nr:carboxypeptidase regulatory-like domain-containing protein [Pyrinomonadaceae bacterium]
LIQDISFSGVETVTTDARVVLTLAEIKDATIQHCEFYGLASFVSGGAIVKSHRCNLKIHDSAFLGCATSSGLTTSVVQVNQWKGFTITGTRFIDYGNRAFFGKTPWSAPYSWIMVGGAATIDSASAWREIVIRDVFLDEGAFVGLSLRPDLFPPSGPIDLFFVSGLRMNVTNLGSYGHYLLQARRLFIEDSHYGWSHNSSGAMHIASSGEVILDQLECVDDAYRISADSETGKLTVINSIYQELDSDAQITNVLNTSPGDDPVEIVRQQFLTSTSQEPEPAALFYWTSLLLNCGTDVQCQQQTRGALATFLGDQPETRFTISGHVRESDGTSVAGATVTLNNLVSVQTDSNGFYSFANLPTSGSYTVAVARNNYTFTPASQVITTPISNHVLEFTGVMRTFVLEGYLIHQNGWQGIPNINVTLTGPAISAVTSDSSGLFRFDQVRAEGTHVVTPESPFFSFQPQSVTYNGLGQNTRTPNIVGTRIKYTISGATGLPGTLLNLSGDASATVTSGADGNYSFLVDAGLNYTIIASKQHYTFSPAIRVFQAISGNRTGENFAPTLNTHTIGGNAGISGITITLSGSASASTISGANGAYSFTVNAGGNYTVTPSKTHYTFTPASQSIIDLSGNVTFNFTPVLNKHTISGNAGMSGVTITLSGSANASTITDSGGAYSHTVDAGGNYTLTATKDNYAFSPASYSFTNVFENIPLVNFSGKPVPMLLTEPNSTKAIALDSATWIGEPFSLSGNHLSPDGLTRVMVFAGNIDLPAGLPIIAQAQDSQQRITPLIVEYAGMVPGTNGLTQINVKLPSELSGNDRVWLSVIVNGVPSNQALILLKP